MIDKRFKNSSSQLETRQLDFLNALITFLFTAETSPVMLGNPLRTSIKVCLNFTVSVHLHLPVITTCLVRLLCVTMDTERKLPWLHFYQNIFHLKRYLLYQGRIQAGSHWFTPAHLKQPGIQIILLIFRPTCTNFKGYQTP